MSIRSCNVSSQFPMLFDDLNPKTLYKLALLILFGADFDRNNNCFSEVS